MTSSSEDQSATENLDEDRASDAIGDLLRRSLEAPPARPQSLLPKIQERIYQRTRGRYFRPKRKFGDSTTLVLGLALLLLVLAATGYLVLRPLLDAEQQAPEAPSAPSRPDDVAPRE